MRLPSIIFWPLVGVAVAASAYVSYLGIELVLVLLEASTLEYTAAQRNAIEQDMAALLAFGIAGMLGSVKAVLSRDHQSVT